MGKSSKKSKHINIGNDFRKQKLKAGKKKPSANATVTTFKSKTIYINEQLSRSENEVLSYSKHSLPELISHLNHYSANFRYRAMVGIKEIVAQKSTSEPAGFNPGSVVQKISKFMVDDDSDVRKTCISLLQLLFDDLPENKMAPHFPLLLSHLYCAMSHISVKVQKDSLKVVESFMKYYPKLVCVYAGMKLLQYFLELISVKESGINSTGRILATTFALKKETAIQWRVRVLSQILSLLKILSQSTVSVSGQRSEPTHFWNSSNLATKLLSAGLTQRGITLDSIQRKSVVSSSNPSAEELLQITFPILLQCWIEVSASDVFEKDVETVQTMLNVLSITYLFCTNISNEFENNLSKLFRVREQYLPLFIKQFFNNFPFETPERNRDEKTNKRRKTTIETAKISDYDHINLLICNLCSLFCSDQHFEEDARRIALTFEYLADYLDSCLNQPFVDSKLVDLVVSSLQRLFSLQSVQVSGFGDSVLNNLYAFCCSSKCARMNRSKIMQFMMKLYEYHSVLKESSCFKQLVSDLPGNFLTAFKGVAARRSDFCKLKQKDSSQQHLISLLKCMQCALRRKDVDFLDSVSKLFDKLVATMDKSYHNLCCSSQLNCIDCIQFPNSVLGCLLPQLSEMVESNFMALSSFCCNSMVHLQSRTYVVDALLMKVLPHEDLFYIPLDKTEVGLFLKLLFTVLLVSNKKDTKVCSSVSHHEILCNRICDSLKQMTEFWPDLWQVQNAFFEKKLKVASSSVGNKTILGILKLGCILVKQNSSEIDLRGIGRFLAAFSMLCAKQSREWEECIRSCVVDLLSVSQIMDSYIRILIKSGSSYSIVSLVKLLETTELQESYQVFSPEITNFVLELEKSQASGELRKLKSLSSAMLAVL